jgi:hypothetical protein
MTEFEPIDLEHDVPHLKNELMEVGRVAGVYVSRAAAEFGNDHPITALFDVVAQGITVNLLQLQVNLLELKRELEIDEAMDGWVDSH